MFFPIIDNLGDTNSDWRSSMNQNDADPYSAMFHVIGLACLILAVGAASMSPLTYVHSAEAVFWIIWAYVLLIRDVPRMSLSSLGMMLYMLGVFGVLRGFGGIHNGYFGHSKRLASSWEIYGSLDGGPGRTIQQY
jgi:hypothetical protein